MVQRWVGFVASRFRDSDFRPSGLAGWRQSQSEVFSHEGHTLLTQEETLSDVSGWLKDLKSSNPKASKAGGGGRGCYGG